MNTGYSILLGEYIKAEHVNYGDCKGFQIMNRSKAVTFLREAAFTTPGFTMLLKLLAEVQHEMVGCLIRLPYFELLREAGHV